MSSALPAPREQQPFFARRETKGEQAAPSAPAVPIRELAEAGLRTPTRRLPYFASGNDVVFGEAPVSMLPPTKWHTSSSSAAA